MRKFDKYLYSFWAGEDNFTSAIYKQFTSMIWNPSEIFLREDLSEWRNIDAKTRDAIVEGLIAYNAIVQIVALEAIPPIISGLDDSYVARQATLSAMQARLTGPHNILTTRMIKDMNSSFLIGKLQKDIRVMEGLSKVIDNLYTIFSSLEGWGTAYHSAGDDGAYGDLDVYQELTYRLWQTCAISAVMIEAAITLPASLLFTAMDEGADMPEVLQAMQIVLMDTTTISTYLCKLAGNKMELLSKEKQEEAKEWFSVFLIEMFEVLWKGMYSNLEIESEDAAYTLLHLNQYNVNKALTKMGLDLMYHTTEMPSVVEKHMGVSTDLVAVSAYNKKQSWLKWRNLL